MAVPAAMSPPVCFGPFVFSAAARQLLRDGRPLRLGDRALDLLAALVDRAGEIVPHAELVARVWPHTIVEASSLRVHMSALRRALDVGHDGPRYIVTAPGEGYGFFGPRPNAGPAVAPPLRCRPAPVLLREPIGREACLSSLQRLLWQRRLVSVVGPGGMGKTTVAIAATRTVAERLRDGLCFVDLADAATARDVVAAVAAALGMPPSEPLARALCDRELLLVLDTCEHVASAVADLVRALLDNAPRVRVLTTGRSPLGVPDERVHRLPPLGLPAPDDPADRHAPAVRLFLERAAAHDDRFSVTAETLPLVHRLCRRLDGMPLAIELVATRVYALGLRTLADGPHDLLHEQGTGRRAAVPRHRTLGALLAWGHAHLRAVDQTVLQRLAILDGPFGTAQAVRTAVDDTITPATVRQSLRRLVTASWIEVTPGPTDRRYRLLATTRSDALARRDAARAPSHHEGMHRSAVTLASRSRAS